jgi:hypothetical protein
MGYHFSLDDGQVIMDRILSKSRVLARHLRACGMKLVALKGIIYVRNLEGTEHPYGCQAERDRALAAVAGAVLGQRLGPGLEPGKTISLSGVLKVLDEVSASRTRTADANPHRLLNLLVTLGFLAREGERLMIRMPWIIFQDMEVPQAGQTPSGKEGGRE